MKEAGHVMPYKALLICCAALFQGCSGAPQSPGQARPGGDFRKPDCPSEGQPSAKELSRKKKDLYQKIEDSKYKTEEIKEETLESYKRQIATKEETACPRDVERYIDSVSSLFKGAL